VWEMVARRGECSLSVRLKKSRGDKRGGCRRILTDLGMNNPCVQGKKRGTMRVLRGDMVRSAGNGA